MRKTVYIFLLLIAFQANAQSSDEAKKTANELLRIAYTGNMGVLIKHQNKTIIIDGLHKRYGADYVFPPESMVKELINGTYKDYSTIAIALATHKHGDHFDAAYFREFLKKNPGSVAIGSQQIKEAIGKLLKKEDSDVLNRVNSINYDGKAYVLTHHGIKVKAFRCNHVSPRHRSIQNIAYIITMGDYKVLHVGDTHWDVSETTLKNLKISDEDLDIAVIPYWMLLDKSSKARVNKLIAPKQIIATHIPPNISESQQRKLYDMHPGIILLTDMGEEIKYK